MRILFGIFVVILLTLKGSQVFTFLRGLRQRSSW